MQNKNSPRYPSADDLFHGLAAQHAHGAAMAEAVIIPMRTAAMQNAPHVVRAGYHPELRQPRK